MTSKPRKKRVYPPNPQFPPEVLDRAIQLIEKGIADTGDAPSWWTLAMELHVEPSTLRSQLIRNRGYHKPRTRDKTPSKHYDPEKGRPCIVEGCEILVVSHRRKDGKIGFSSSLCWEHRGPKRDGKDARARRKCLVCGKLFTVKLSEVRAAAKEGWHRGRYCSISCRAIDMVGKKRPRKGQKDARTARTADETPKPAS